MKHQPDNFAAFQDRIFQEIEDGERLESQGSKRIWTLMVGYGQLCGLSEDEVRSVLTVGMTVRECIAVMDNEGKKKEQRR